MDVRAMVAQAETILRGKGDPAQAFDLCRKVLRRSGDDVAALRLGGIAAYLCGRHDQAVTWLEQGLRLSPDDPVALMNLGNAQQALGLWDQAVAAFSRLVSLHPDLAAGHYNMGNALMAAGRFQSAQDCFRQALRCQPGHAWARVSLAGCLRHLDQFQDAETQVRAVLAAQPDFAPAHTALGQVLSAQGHHDRAEACHRRALALVPDLVQARINLSQALCDQSRFTEAEHEARIVSTHHPAKAEGWHNLGAALSPQGRFEEALAAFDRVLALRPDDVEVRVSRAYDLLRLGCFPQGWADHEARLRRKGFQVECAPALRWDGAPLDGRSLLIRSEQGLGDTLQFIRYADLLRRRDQGPVLVQVQQPLVRLLRHSLPDLDIIGSRDPVPRHDLCVPLLSLPGLFKTDLSTIPADGPYLRAETDRVAAWRDRLPKTGLRVGIVWQGNPKAAVDRGRSMPLASLAPLANIAGVHLISLQKNHGAEQLADLAGVCDLGPDFDAGTDAFIDSAAVMANLDVIVTTDTALAHLAGGMGRPTWVMLQKWPDWRWLLDRTDSPWYPTARLFRQRVAGEWSDVVADIVQALIMDLPQTRLGEIHDEARAAIEQPGTGHELSPSPSGD